MSAPIVVPPRPNRDAGFTLPEMLIALILTGTIVSVLALTIATSLRTAPSVTSRADSAIAVQGITTWLPPDVDSAEPGQFNIVPGTASGCSGVDPGNNIIRLQWSETFRTITTTYVADYRFVINGTVGEIVRVSCSGKFALGAPSVMSMTAQLSATPPVVTPDDFDGDGKVDKVTLQIQTLSGEVVFIEAATKNPNETLPPVSTVAGGTTTTTTTTTTTPTTTTTTTPPNASPTATPMHVTVNDAVPAVFNLQGTDPEGGALTGTVTNVPPGWVVAVSGTTVTLTAFGAAGTATLTYQVADPVGASSPVTNLVIEITASATTSTTSTTTTSTTTTTTPPTTSTTTTTTIPPCTVATMTVNPNPVALQSNGTGKLKKDVAVTIGGLTGYCVGLTLQYDTGAPNGQYVQNFGTSSPYIVTLQGHPHGTELWTNGTHVLEVRDGFNRLLNQANLVVTN